MKVSPNVVSTVEVATEGKVSESVPKTTTVWPLLSVVVDTVLLAPWICVEEVMVSVPVSVPVCVIVPVWVRALVSVLVVWAGMMVEIEVVGWPTEFVVIIVSIQAPTSLHVVPLGQHPYMQQVVPVPQRLCCPSGVVQQVSP